MANTEELTSEYWIKRSVRRLSYSEGYAIKTLAQLSDSYKQAQNNIQTQIDSLYANYAEKGVLKKEELRRALNANEKAKFILDVKKKAKELGIKYSDIVDERYLWRLSRLEALQEQIKLEIAVLGQKEEKLTTESYRKTVKDSYSRFQQDLQKQGITPAFAILSDAVTNAIITSKWEGRDFKTSIWKNKTKLMQELPSLLASSMISGQSPAVASRTLRDRMQVGLSDARRLVITETNYMHGQGELQSYVDDGFKEYEYVAILDERTSKICEGLDNKVFKVEDAVVGENYPPMHAYCRSTTVPVFENEVEGRKVTESTRTFKNRTARLEKTKKTNIEKERTLLYTKMNLTEEETSHFTNDIFNNADVDINVDKLTAQQKQFVVDSGLTIHNDLPEDMPQVLGMYKEGGNKLYFNSPELSKLPEARSQQVILHELGHAVDANKKLFDTSISFEPKGLDYSTTKVNPNGRFSQSKEFQILMTDQVDAGVSLDAMGVAKHRVEVDLEDSGYDYIIKNMNVEDFKKAVLIGDPIKTNDGGSIDINYFNLINIFEPTEIFAEAYSMFHTEPKTLKAYSPEMYRYINYVSNLK